MIYHHSWFLQKVILQMMFEPNDNEKGFGHLEHK